MSVRQFPFMFRLAVVPANGRTPPPDEQRVDRGAVTFYADTREQALAMETTWAAEHGWTVEGEDE